MSDTNGKAVSDDVLNNVAGGVRHRGYEYGVCPKCGKQMSWTRSVQDQDAGTGGYYWCNDCKLKVQEYNV